MQTYLPVLQNCSLFSGVAPSDLQALLACLGARKIEVSRQSPILREGDPAEYVGILLRGSAMILREDFYGNRSIMSHVEPGDLFGESYAFAETKTFPVSIVADEDCDILFIDGHRITNSCSNACDFHNRMVYNMLRIVAQKNLACYQRMQITAQRTTREKLMMYLTMQAKLAGSNTFIIPYDRQELADYLDVDRSGLSAEISRLRREGVIECEKNRFKIL